MEGIGILARTLSYYNRLQEVAANNLANVNAEGFKAHRMTAALSPDGAPIPIEELDLSQGKLRQTGRPLDLALDGPGFFVVRGAQGDRLIRGGSFRLDAAGMVVDGQGDPVLGVDGPIAAPTGQLEIREDGTVLIDGGRVAQLQVVTVADPKALAKEGHGRFVTAQELIPVEAGTLIHQGHLEEANFDAVRGMVDLVMIQRAYAANTDALRVMDGVLSTITGDLGRL